MARSRKAPAGVPDGITEDEMRRLVAKLARRGNMPACRFYFETWIRPAVEGVKLDGVDALAEVDDLARRRAVR